jgi:coenzyme F420 hydrogenase subunit beta
VDRHIASIRDVAERQLCTGCGVCAFVQPDDIRMVDDLDAGRRPMVRRTDGQDVDTSAALRACPGAQLGHGGLPEDIIPELRAMWGPVLEVWEGVAGDPVIRKAGSSGGAATAFALDAMERRGYAGTLHIRARSDVPYLNETTLSTDRDALLAATGSRYAPASPCDRLDLIRDADAPCVFIGKPCDVGAVAKVRAGDLALDARLGLTVAIFCAGTPTTRGTLELLERLGVDDPDDQLVSLRYRGNGWPGLADAEVRTDGGTEHRTATYDESWGEILQRHRQWRCYVCADHTGEFADIAVGDPWYREIEPGESGRSLILVRTERGRAALRAALASGALSAEPVAADRVPASQPGLRKVRGAVWGRLVASRLLGVPAPRYQGLPTFGAWWSELGWADRLRAVFGLERRIRRRGLRHRHPVRPLESPGSTSDE